jgi:hypothetical protein
MAGSVNFFVRVVLRVLSSHRIIHFEAWRMSKWVDPVTWRPPVCLLKLDSLHRFWSGSGTHAVFYGIRDCD